MDNFFYKLIFILFFLIFPLRGFAQLEADNEKILEYRDIKIKDEKGEVLDIVKEYDYISNEITEKNIIFKDVVKFSNTELLNDNTYKFYSGDKYYKENDRIYIIKKGVTTITEFQKNYKEDLSIYRSQYYFYKTKIAKADEIFANSSDGHLQTTEGTWTNVRNGTNINISYDTNDLVVGGYISGSNYSIWRGYLPMDTGLLPDNILIGTSSIFLYAETINNSDNDGKNYISVVKANFFDPLSVRTTDYNNYNLVKSSNDLSLNSATTSYNEFILNDDGKKLISTTTFSQFGFREGHDIENEAYAVSTYTRIRFSETGTLNKDPYLIVNFSLIKEEEELATSTFYHNIYCYQIDELNLDEVVNCTATTSNNVSFTKFKIPFMLWLIFYLIVIFTFLHITPIIINIIKKWMTNR